MASSGSRAVAAALANAEERIEGLLRERQADLQLTRARGSVVGLENVLLPLLEAIRHAAAELDVEQRERSERWRAGAVLTSVWADLSELDPTRLSRSRSGEELPADWPRLHSELMRAAELAIAELDRLPTRAESGG